MVALRQYDVVLCDIDGVLHVGPVDIDGVPELLQDVVAGGTPDVWVPFGRTFDMPAAAQSARCGVRVTTGTGAVHVFLRSGVYDQVYADGRVQASEALLSGGREKLHAGLLDGSVEPVLSGRVGFDGLPAALRALADRETVGRVVFTPD